MTGRHRIGGEWFWCPVHRKRGYTSRKSAQRVRRGHPDRKHLAVYACNATDGRWHLGHKPPQLYRGDITRDQLFERRTA